MDCPAFERWLDEGRPAEGRAAAQAHAHGCPACAQAEQVALGLEGALAQRFAVAPEGFAARVATRLPQRVSPVVPEPPDPFPWFVRMLLEPSTLLGLSLGGIYAIWAGDLWTSARGLAAGLGSHWGAALAGLPGPLSTSLSVVVAAVLLSGGSFFLYRLADGIGSRLFRATAR